MANLQNKKLLILGDRNFNRHNRTLVDRYLTPHFTSVTYLTPNSPFETWPNYDGRQGSMNHFSHVLVACVTSFVAKPHRRFSEDREENVKANIKWFLGELKKWRSLNLHITMTIVPPTTRFDVLTYLHHEAIYKEEFANWYAQNDEWAYELRPITVHRAMYQEDCKTMRIKAIF